MTDWLSCGVNSSDGQSTRGDTSILTILQLLPIGYIRYLSVTHLLPLFPCLDAKREWGKPRQSLMGETPKTALPPQDRNGAFSVGELNSPRVAPLHRSHNSSSLLDLRNPGCYKCSVK
ncbi:hypothetical protein [Moorena sp. SIO3I6]|uniref:hypothetical protein n=1 Tax=Moorena sp. SIO3I6 TaxID=2607831 RepID=UPI0013FB3AEC|nr:hypothetical protein [Moorena sp. SIO3I6]NEP22272.1 hypothetical protein [Moorena sp. SIO3I6]